MDCKPIALVSVVVPVYNEEASLPELIARIECVCAQLRADYELILVDDGSRDGSVELLAEAAERPGSRVTALILNRNYGQHAALLAGFAEARGDLIVTLDADLQNPPEEIPRLVAAAEEGYEVVGSVRARRHDSAFRRLASRLINRVMRSATGVRMSDYGCMLRAYRRPIVETILACQERSTFIPVLANLFARRTTEIEVRHEERRHSESKYGFLKLIGLMFDLLTCVSTAPLRLLSFIGAVVAGMGFALAFVLLTLRLVYGSEWGVNGVFPLFALLFIFVGMQFIGMGVMGEYIGRIYSEVRARPRYVVQEIVRGRRPVVVAKGPAGPRLAVEPVSVSQP
jgi:undecaprenyl-phosphate 4-deoxy-4-formamido-L-arabinose transferase